MIRLTENNSLGDSYMARYGLRRAVASYEGALVYMIKGEPVIPSEVQDVDIVFDLSDTGKPVIPDCPDCGHSNAWAETGQLSGTKKCTNCASLFTLEIIPESTMRKI